ncbi:MAG: subclass B3 metallo-beta-lactamase [Acidobacteriota bacterium]|nr:subclass B3 metallo-beta-lactamase [Acidobacteriota bacterium]
MPRFVPVSAAVLLSVLAFAQPKHEGNSPIPPYRIIGNIYYVGADDITAYLIATSAGDIVLNAGYEDTAPIVLNGIQKLGFKPRDVKILLNGQAHYDHVAGLKALQDATGAKIWSSEPEVAVLESGGAKDPRWGKEVTYPPVHVDHVVRDGERLTLGGVTLVAHMTPGHSIGCTTWTMQVSDGGRQYDVVFVGGTTINPGVRLVKDPLWPGIAADYETAFRVLRSLHCDVFLGAHGAYYGMREKIRRMGGPVNPFIDPEGYRNFIDKSEKTFLDQVAAEKAGR